MLPASSSYGTGSLASNSRVRRLGFTTVVTLVVLGIAEGTSRLVGVPPSGPGLALEAAGERWPAFTRGDPKLGWRQEPRVSSHDPIWREWNRQQALGRPDDGAVVTNARGWRDDPVPSVRPDGARWVLALGDSSVWGSGCPSEERFTERVESALAPHDVQIWNAAVPGYSTWQARSMLDESEDLPLDAVLLYTMVSDMGAARGLPDDLWFSSPTRQRGTAALSQSHFYEWVRFWVFRLRAARRIARDPEMQLRVHVSQYQENLEVLVAQARRPGTRRGWRHAAPEDRPHGDSERYVPRSDAERTTLQAELTRLSGQPSADATTRDYRIAMALTFDRLGVPWVDGPRRFRAARDRAGDGPHLFVDPVHPSPDGHRVLSEAIAPVLASALGLAADWHNEPTPEFP